MTAPASTSPSPCYLLELPAELRNRIYRDSLCVDHHIDIYEQTVKQSSIIRTCRQIRAGASGIYYKDNRFSSTIDDFDARMDIKFCQTHATPYLDFEKVPLYMDMDPNPTSWKRLPGWLHTFHDGTTSRPLGRDDDEDNEPGLGDLKVWNVAAGAFGFVKEMEGLGWERVLVGVAALQESDEPHNPVAGIVVVQSDLEAACYNVMQSRHAQRKERRIRTRD